MQEISKDLAYQGLIAKIKQDYQSEPGGLKWCDDCKEINLWAYWQGRGHLNARILLVGQDWGCPSDATAVMTNIQRINAGEVVSYMDGNDNTTNQNLIRLFQEIGYRINTNDTKNEDLFFTNLVLGYRSGKISGGLQKNWVKHDAPYFKELVEIIQPEVILCLGRDTFEGVLMAFDHSLSPGIRNYNQFLTSERNPLCLSMEGEKMVYIFALAHCGALGTMNRNRGSGAMHDPLQRQIEDWRKIVPYLI